MEWFRWYHGAISDPKWPLIAKKSGQNIGTVVSIWAAILEHASQNSERGSVVGFDPDTIDALYGYEDGTTVTVCNAMKRHGVLHETEHVISWEKRQPKREREDSSGDRVRRFREKQKLNNAEHIDDSNANETPCNASVTQETPRTEQNRTDIKKDLSEKPKTVSHDSPFSLPCEDGSEFTYDDIFIAAARKAYPLTSVEKEVTKARAWLEGNPTKKKTRRGMKKFLNGWMARAQGDAEKNQAKSGVVETTGHQLTDQDRRPAKWLREAQI